MPGFEFWVPTDKLKIAIQVDKRCRKLTGIEGNQAIIAFTNHQPFFAQSPIELVQRSSPLEVEWGGPKK